MKRLQETDAERLVRTLDQEIRSRGRGSIRAVDRAAGHREGWWQHRAESGNITVHQLLKVLDHLGLDPVGFVRRALGAEGGLELDRSRGKPPEIVAKAWDRVRSGAEGSGVGATYLDTLDQQRYQEPGEVVRLALWAVDHVELEFLPRLLGVAGSAWRLLILLDEAEHAIHAGIEIAQQQDDLAAVGNRAVTRSGPRASSFGFAQGFTRTLKNLIKPPSILGRSSTSSESFTSVKPLSPPAIWLESTCSADGPRTPT
ncbi:MAG: hypothetical protein GY856_43120 [bacterium]|nr:hypothetical protein [bacterium]